MTTQKTPQEILTGLPMRERQVLLLIMAELTQTQIAAELNLSAKTVNTYKTNLMNRLGVRSTVGLLRLAVGCGL